MCVLHAALETSRAVAQANLEADEALFRAVSSGRPAAWRLYVNPPCVVVGRFQRIEREVDLEAAERYGVPCLARFTGGGAVYHDEGNLNFSVCEPRSPGRSLLRYERYTDWLITLLADFGLEGKSVGNRVEVGGKKVTGLAARVGALAVFVHGTLLVNTDLSRLRELLRVPARQRESLPPPKGVHVLSCPFPETTLSIEAGRVISIGAVRERAGILLHESFGCGYAAL